MSYKPPALTAMLLKATSSELSLHVNISLESKVLSICVHYSSLRSLVKLIPSNLIWTVLKKHTRPHTTSNKHVEDVVQHHSIANFRPISLDLNGKNSIKTCSPSESSLNSITKTLRRRA